MLFKIVHIKSTTSKIFNGLSVRVLQQDKCIIQMCVLILNYIELFMWILE